MTPTEPAVRFARPPNQQTKANAVAMRLTNAKPASSVGPSGGGAPSTAIATTVSSRPPATSCHAVIATSGTPGSAQRFVSTAPNDDSTSADADAATPSGGNAPPARPTIATTPAMPSSAPTSIGAAGRSAISTQAQPASTSGASAMIDEATEVGSSWAATYTRRKNAPTLSTPSTVERHHQLPRGSRRASRSSTNPAGSARSAEPQNGASAGSTCRVTK